MACASRQIGSFFLHQVELHYFRNHHHLIDRKNQRNGTLVVCFIVMTKDSGHFFWGQETIPFTTYAKAPAILSFMSDGFFPPGIRRC